jgi:hypothetical protein
MSICDATSSEIAFPTLFKQVDNREWEEYDLRGRGDRTETSCQTNLEKGENVLYRERKTLADVNYIYQRPC